MMRTGSKRYKSWRSLGAVFPRHGSCQFRVGQSRRFKLTPAWTVPGHTRTRNLGRHSLCVWTPMLCSARRLKSVQRRREEAEINKSKKEVEWLMPVANEQCSVQSRNLETYSRHCSACPYEYAMARHLCTSLSTLKPPEPELGPWRSCERRRKLRALALTHESCMTGQSSQAGAEREAEVM